MKIELTQKLEEFMIEQKYNELANKTLGQYRRTIERFIEWIPNDVNCLSKDITLLYKKEMGNVVGSKNTLNNWIVIINKFLKWLGHDDLTIKKIKIQHRSSNEEVLTNVDYKRLLRISKRDNMMEIYHIMKILAMTGIRVSELEFFTVENLLKSNYIKVFNKQKERVIIVRQDLRRELKKYCKENKIKEGYIFKSKKKDNTMICQSTIWRQMKKVAGKAKVNKKRVHAHSFRHLFAQLFIEEYENQMTELADVLGHNSLETTRTYTRSSIDKKREKLERMKF